MADSSNSPDSVEEVTARLKSLKDKRGYLLPHHGLLAVAEPTLLEAYDRTYTALTLTPRSLSEHAKEFVWLVILTSTEEAIATHHIKRFRDGGGTDEELELAVRLCAYAMGVDRFAFVAQHWSPHLPNYDAERSYRAGVDAIAKDYDIPKGLIEMALAATHTCHRQWWALKLHIAGAYRENVPERELAEAISLTMFPGGVPNFVDAADHWKTMISAGEVSASPAFRAWADMPGQGGYDESVGKGPAS
tara:strand:- start:2938 stop:3678 length:741 start_codon:yes stop_codon:yes gene_type:complete